MGILITSLVSLAVHISLTWDEMILKPLGDKLSEMLPELLRKPLFECLPCMGAWQALLIWIISILTEDEGTFLHHVLHVEIEIGLIPMMLGSVGMNTIILLLISSVRAKQKMNELYELSNGIESIE